MAHQCFGRKPGAVDQVENGKHTTHRWPWFLPDGKHFLFFATNHAGDTEQGIFLGSLEDGSYKRLLDSDSGAQYASGYLLYHLQSQLLAQKFDASRGVVSGDPIPVANVAEYDSGTWHTTFAVSQNGLLIYEPGTKTLGSDLSWLDRSGEVLGKVAERAFYKGRGGFLRTASVWPSPREIRRPTSGSSISLVDREPASLLEARPTSCRPGRRMASG